MTRCEVEVRTQLRLGEALRIVCGAVCGTLPRNANAQTVLVSELRHVPGWTVGKAETVDLQPVQIPILAAGEGT